MRAAELRGCVICGQRKMRTKRGSIYVPVVFLRDDAHRSALASIEVHIHDVEYQECEWCDEQFYSLAQCEEHRVKAAAAWEALRAHGVTLDDFKPIPPYRGSRRIKRESSHV